MKNKKLVAIICCAAVIALLAAAYFIFFNKPAKINGGKFTMGIDPEYPPFSYIGDDGEYTGFDVEICKAACEKLGLDFQIFAVNWDQKLVQMDSKECDCIWSGMTILPSMTEAGYVISKPYFDNTQVIVVKTDSTIAGPADLAGKVVAVQNGTSAFKMVSEGGDQEALGKTFASLTTPESYNTCFAELDGGAVDAVIVDQPVALDQIKKNANLKILDGDLGSEQYGIAFRSGDAELCAKIEEAVAGLVKDGTYARIASKDEYKDITNNLIFLSDAK